MDDQLALIREIIPQSSVSDDLLRRFLFAANGDLNQAVGEYLSSSYAQTGLFY